MRREHETRVLVRCEHEARIELAMLLDARIISRNAIRVRMTNVTFFFLLYGRMFASYSLAKTKSENSYRE